MVRLGHADASLLSGVSGVTNSSFEFLGSIREFAHPSAACGIDLRSDNAPEEDYQHCSAGSAHPMRSPRPSCFSRRTTAPTLGERSCSWMAVSHKCRPLRRNLTPHFERIVARGNPTAIALWRALENLPTPVRDPATIELVIVWIGSAFGSEMISDLAARQLAALILVLESSQKLDSPAVPRFCVAPFAGSTDRQRVIS